MLCPKTEPGSYVMGNTRKDSKTLGFGYEPHQILGVVQRFSNHCSCHPEGECMNRIRSKDGLL
jgi:hypothetical protein